MADGPQATELKVESWPTDALREHPDNPRVGDVDAIARSIERYGQVRPVLIRSDGEIIAGAHTWKAITLLGRPRTEVVVNDTMTVEEAEAYMLADNALADRGHYDTGNLARVLSRAQEANGADLEAATGYTQADLDALLAEVAAGEGGGGPDERGKLLELADVTTGEPTHKVSHGEVYRLGGVVSGHVLIVADLFTDHALWAPWLARSTGQGDEAPLVFVPYPTPHLPFSDLARGRRLVMVCPDPFLAGKLLDAWAAIEGEDQLTRAGKAGA